MLKKKLRKSAKEKLGYTLVLAGIGLGIASMVLMHIHTPPPLDKLSAPDFTRSSDASDRPSKTEMDSYSVPAANPKFITIPAIDIPKSKVVALGLNQDRSMAVPGSSYDTGWYDASAKPGEKGAMFIYGHVAGWNNGGVFYNLKELKDGDDIIIARGDGKTYTYRVVSSKTYPYSSVDMSAVLSPLAAGTPGLNLMTCAGKVIPGSKPVNFDERLVVFTKLVNVN